MSPASLGHENYPECLCCGAGLVKPDRELKQQLSEGVGKGGDVWVRKPGLFNEVSD